MAQIDKPNLHFNTLLYTGDGTSPRAMTGVGFQPDFLWIKNRTGATGYEHRLMDAVRGSNKVLHSSGTGAENTEEYYTVGSFDSDGWTGRNGTGSNQAITGGNDNGYTFAAWNWKANGAGSANTDGSINSTVSVNTTAGFSIVKYAGTGSNATIGHGLGVAPKMIIIKNRSQTNGWIAGHEELDASNPWHKYYELNSTNAAADLNTIWNDTAPTSTVFTVGTEAAVNNNGNNFIAYCFAEKKGYSKIGKYSGNGNVNGTFVYTGFKPALIIIKDKDNAENWFIFDNKRPGYNLNANHLNPNSNTTETASTANTMDLLSNGFKMRATNNGINRSGGEGFTYLAIAENPIVGSNNVAATAR